METKKYLFVLILCLLGAMLPVNDAFAQKGPKPKKQKQPKSIKKTFNNAAAKPKVKRPTKPFNKAAAKPPVKNKGSKTRSEVHLKPKPTLGPSSRPVKPKANKPAAPPPSPKPKTLKGKFNKAAKPPKS